MVASSRGTPRRDAAVNAYSPASSFGWLDLDAAASERVATLLRALEEPGTLDPLGLGSVRDAFSWMLSPGTSTIQTRLRYLVFLPWIFAGLEALRVPPADFARRLRDAEAQLIDCLRHLGPNHGVIGYQAGRELKRMPSEVYWGSLGSWGIRRLDVSLAEYGKRAAALGRLRAERDDDGNAIAASPAMWAPMPDPPDDFLHADIDFDLRRDEAKFLVDHIREHHPESLLAALCAVPELAAGADLPWNLPAEVMSMDLREILRHAQCFSELTVGPQHVYNIMLARKARVELRWETTELETAESDRLAAWAQLIATRYADLRAWVDDLPAFWAVLATSDAVSDRTRGFVNDVVRRAVDNPASIADDPHVQAAIRTRELQLKSKRARLGHRSALENWNGAPFGGQLDYRWPITKSYLRDIATAMRQET
jgi:hypothetical protein